MAKARSRPLRRCGWARAYVWWLVLSLSRVYIRHDRAPCNPARVSGLPTTLVALSSPTRRDVRALLITKDVLSVSRAFHYRKTRMPRRLRNIHILSVSLSRESISVFPGLEDLVSRSLVLDRTELGTVDPRREKNSHSAGYRAGSAAYREIPFTRHGDVLSR